MSRSSGQGRDMCTGARAEAEARKDNGRAMSAVRAAATDGRQAADLAIAQVSAHVLRVPFRYPLLQHDSYSMLVLVRIETDGGLVGHGLASYPLIHSVRDFITREVGPAIHGLHALEIEAVRARMRTALARKQEAGAYASALSLIDMALWDIAGQATGQPIWRLLGGARRTVPVYVTFGLLEYTTEQLLEVARTLVAQGHTRLKVVVGSLSGRMAEASASALRDPVRHDAARIRALCTTIGQNVQVMVDANKSFSLPQAIRLARMLEPFDITWFEDAVVGADPRLLAQLRRSTSVPIAAGSTGTSTLQNAREYLLHEAVDYLQPNVRDIGGFTGARAAAALAQAFNVPIEMGGNWPHINAHLHAGVPNGGRVEFHWQGWQVGTLLLDGAMQPEGDQATLSERPGLGFTPKEGIVAEFGVD